ncbi:MAG: hypothetical protein LBL78_01590 [Prevotellaceae bacterium]|nr:hypothetical protein [Prevotellaceae bacterium]
MKAMIIYSMMFFLPVTASCASSPRTPKNDADSLTYYDPSARVDADNVPLDAAQHYFPVMASTDSIAPDSSALFTRHNDVDAFSNKWYSRHLFALREPLLYNKPMPRDIVRFTWLRTFDNPVAVRMERSDSGIMLYWKRCNGNGGYKPGTLVADGSKPLTEAQWSRLQQLLDEASFRTPPAEPVTFGADGSQWIVEATGRDYYLLMDVWSGGRLRPVGLYLLSLTDMAFGQSDIY